MNALVIRAEPLRAALAEWFIQQLDPPAEPGRIAAYTYPESEVVHTTKIVLRANDVRVFFFAHAISKSGAMQDMMNVFRTGADIPRVFPMNSRRAIIIRGEPERVALAEWLVKQLDKKPEPGRTPVSYELNDSNPGPNASRTVRVFYLDHATSPESMQSLIKQMRTQAQIQRVFPMNELHAIVAAGRPEQVAAAEKMVADAEAAATTR